MNKLCLSGAAMGGHHYLSMCVVLQVGCKGVRCTHVGSVWCRVHAVGPDTGCMRDGFQASGGFSRYSSASLLGRQCCVTGNRVWQQGVHSLAVWAADCLVVSGG